MWGFAAEAGVWSVVIAVMQPVRVGRGPGCIPVVVAGVRSLRREGSVEPLNLPVRLGSVGTCEAVLGLTERGRGGVGAVAGAVVRHHRVDLDAGGCEEHLRSVPEPDRGVAELVVVDL